MVLRVLATALQIIAFTVLVTVQEVASDDAVQLSESFGGPHGNDFSDQASVVSGQTITSITVRAGDRVDGVSLGISAPTAQTFTHGGTGGTGNTLTLAKGEHITSMEAHWGEKSGHTRIFYLNFGTSAGNSISGGSQTDSKGSVTAPKGYQLGGFFGRDGDEIDTLGAIWSSIQAADDTPGTVAPAQVPIPAGDGTAEPASAAAPPASSESVAPATSGSRPTSSLGSTAGSGSVTTPATPSSPKSPAGSGSAPPASTSKGSSDSSSAGAPAPTGPAVRLSETFGGPHGNEFSDQSAATSGQTIASLTVRGANRIDGLSLEVSGPKAQTFTHGGTGGDPYTLKLGKGEYITSMEAHWGQKGGHTRIFYLNFGTSAGNSVSAGTQTDEKGSVTAPDGYQLGGFFGRDGDEVDLLGVVWTSIAVVKDNPTSGAGAGTSGSNPAVAVSDEDIVLSPLYGGPHGNAFSDIDSIKFSQTVSSITVRSDKRVDAITLQIQAPAEVTMSHGGNGGEEKTLTLAPGEFITSMEAHWGKKDDHTRVFYLNFETNKGNSISGGTKTDDNAVAKAPDGFQLAGFYGRAEGEVDQLGAIWTRISAKDLSLTDEEESSGSGIMYGTTIRNWVGPTIGESSDTACYRKSVDFDSNNICPLGYGKEDTNCQAQCPLSYPVQCSLECIPQNDDCVLEALSKIGSVVAVALNLATAGVFGDIYAAYKTAKWAVTCAANVVTALTKPMLWYTTYL
ncbi:hypothetical protein ON010_g6357 [Phytophthora cinnamomi]|nr:hypothetical protein ON010_g6357 [Phytophthora cinnamomi]